MCAMLYVYDGANASCDVNSMYYMVIGSSKFEDFINTQVVPKFNGQRIQDNQFAVLILSQYSINEIQNTQLSTL